MSLRFVKMHGAANDFVVVDHRTPFLPADPGSLVRRLCDRRRGVGADGVLLLERDPELDFAMGYYNADGGRAEFCGNGARCLARFALDLGLGRGGVVRFRTDVGIQEAQRSADGRGISLHFGPVEPAGESIAIEAGGRRVQGRLIRAGVPHFVVAVERVGDVDLPASAPPLRRHARFAPAGANVDFVERQGPSRWAMRTWERGVEGETLACGSGAIATAVFAAAAGDGSPVQVLTAGGDTLEVALATMDDRWDARLIGPAEVSFAGEWPETGD
jgi:diaminopimelate epimerase